MPTTMQTLQIRERLKFIERHIVSWNVKIWKNRRTSSNEVTQDPQRPSLETVAGLLLFEWIWIYTLTVSVQLYQLCLKNMSWMLRYICIVKALTKRILVFWFNWTGKTVDKTIKRSVWWFWFFDGFDSSRFWPCIQHFSWWPVATRHGRGDSWASWGDYRDACFCAELLISKILLGFSQSSQFWWFERLEHDSEWFSFHSTIPFSYNSFFEFRFMLLPFGTQTTPHHCLNRHAQKLGKYINISIWLCTCWVVTCCDLLWPNHNGTIKGIEEVRFWWAPMGPSLPGRPISCSVLCARGQLLGPGGDVATKQATHTHIYIYIFKS